MTNRHLVFGCMTLYKVMTPYVYGTLEWLIVPKWFLLLQYFHFCHQARALKFVSIAQLIFQKLIGYASWILSDFGWIRD